MGREGIESGEEMERRTQWAGRRRGGRGAHFLPGPWQSCLKKRVDGSSKGAGQDREGRAPLRSRRLPLPRGLHRPGGLHSATLTVDLKGAGQ